MEEKRMSKSVQSIQSIAPMQDGQNTKTADPVQADYEKGKEYLQKQELSQAAVAFHNALVGFQQREDQQGIANASNQMGHVCLAKREYDQALGHYNRAWEICEKLHDPMSLLSLSNQLVLVHRGRGQFKNAISICLDLLEKYHDNNDPRGTVAVLEQMAEIYIEAGEQAKAADTYRTIASIHANFKHKNIAQGYLQKAQDLEKAG
jgi:tetratricopeptide (TPR) repeat protein